MSSWPVTREEPVGAEAKFWLQGDDGYLWLFKPVRHRANSERRDLDVAEKIAAEVACLLDLPSATVELAVRAGEEGVISRDVRPGGDELYGLRDGADQLIDVGAAAFEPSASLDPVLKKLRPGHSLSNIDTALRDVEPPEGCTPGLTAFDVFTGYLLLDAWIGNADRHDQNWAVLEPQLTDPNAKRVLSPT